MVQMDAMSAQETNGEPWFMWKSSWTGHCNGSFACSLKTKESFSLGSSTEIIISLGDFNGHVGKSANGFEGVRWAMVSGKEMRKEEDCWSFVMKRAVRGQQVVL